MTDKWKELKKWVDRNKYDPNEDKIEPHGGAIDVDDLFEKMEELGKDGTKRQKLKDRLNFLEGVKHGISMYAWNKNGKQYVGTCDTELSTALTEVHRDVVKLFAEAGYDTDTGAIPNGQRVEGINYSGESRMITVTDGEFRDDEGRVVMQSILGWKHV